LEVIRMADEEIFANPNAADAKGRDAMAAAEHYGYVLTWVRGAVQAAIAAAGHPLVADGYEQFLGAARGQLERLRQHGIGAGSNLWASAAIVDGTDADNAGMFGAAAGGLQAAANPDGGHRP
jgi:hypothetical protein